MSNRRKFIDAEVIPYQSKTRRRISPFIHLLHRYFRLRHFLTKQGFRLPGESQKIDHLISTFARCYWEDNGGNQGLCKIQHQDTVYVLSFAIILLNTNLHKEPSKRKGVHKMKHRGKKMTKNDFCKNIRSIEHSEGLSREYLSEIYDSISNNPVEFLE